MAEFQQGLDLARCYYVEAVEPILDEEFPDVKYAAGLVGAGSEILGFDTAMSADHDWGPRLMVFLEDIKYKEPMSAVLRKKLPPTFRGYSTSFTPPSDEAGDIGTTVRSAGVDGNVDHRVEFYTVDTYMRSYLGVDTTTEMTPADWLSLPQQRLRSFTAGAIFHDDLGTLTTARNALAYYPRDVWLYMMACGWMRISEEDHLAPRAGFVGDELGSTVIAGRLVKSIMDLAFLMERQYAPYAKWFGTAFAKLQCAPTLTPHLRQAQSAPTYRDREAGLVAAFKILNTMHNDLQCTPLISPAVSQFHNRPFNVSQGWRYDAALRAAIQDSAVRDLASRFPAGSIDQLSVERLLEMFLERSCSCPRTF